MGVEKTKKKLESSRFYGAKKLLDRTLPLALIGIAVSLYLEFLSAPEMLYRYKTPMEYLILFYFASELTIDLMLYEENRDFFRERWLDIVLTMPFLAAFKGLRGLKLLKSFKLWKGFKLGKFFKIGKLGQKFGKLMKKAKKIKKKHL